MPSAFEEVVKSVIKEVDRKGELIPVDSLRNSTSFRPYRLLSRKLSSSWFWKPRYRCVNLSIKDILEPSAPEPEPECCGRFCVSDAVDGNIQGRVALAGTGQGKISGAAAMSGSCSASINMRILRVAQNAWDVMQRERHLQTPEHKILQQLRSRGDDVFVVTEVLQTEEDVQVTQTLSKEGLGQLALPGALCLQGEGKGYLSQKKMVTIPAGSVLAFRVAQLLIDPKWDILLFPNEKKRTFQQPPSSHRRQDGQRQHTFNLLSTLWSMGERLKLLTDGSHEEQVTTEDFQGLRAEVKAVSTELEYLEMELRQQLLVAIGRILHDQPSMEALEASLEQGLCHGGQVEPLDGPAGSILECLVLPSGEPVLELAVPILYLLGALTVLNETQQRLLARALEAAALSEQLELVEYILEQSMPWQEQSFVSLTPRLCGSSWREGAPAWVLLEECGLALQVDTPQVHWGPKSQGPTCALYASLALLSGLSQKPC
ncbi:gasdermin-D isoform X2 [Mesocricetus auratus]|uniref:Gasdermin-D isoform X1 n=1 Tax=Mesocricetus auratus TaxID=10036 RepID=A0A1U7R4Y3_MESAU|nr:gasdermin-D isoform X2 [Mesocricetus auratus]XP_040592347.1 gasdermin-D isoform X2 [Mesocricetus auratus]XP_040592348.1 gasdermin-D isoform X2 [Mesocricetus auratus]